MMGALKERQLRLSSKKNRMGHIKQGFHFLGVQYPGTQTLDNTNVPQVNDGAIAPVNIAHYLTSLGGETNVAADHQTPALENIVPHPRTLRKAREQVKHMVMLGISSRRIRRYLNRWATWWVGTSECWQYQELLVWFIKACWSDAPAAYAAGLLHHAIKKSHTQNPAQDQARVSGSLAFA